MTSGLGYAIAAMVLFGVADVVYKRGAAAGVPPRQTMMVQSWVFFSTVTLYGLLTGMLAFVPGVLWGCLAGLFMWSGYFNFAHSLRTGSISINGPIFRLSFVITAVLAVLFLGERATLAKGAGIALALAAVWLLLGGGRVRLGREARVSLIRVLIASASVGIGSCIYKLGLRAGATAPSLVVAQAVVVVTVSTVMAGVAERRIRPSALALRHAPRSGALLGLGFAMMVESLARGEASRMVPVAQMGLAVAAVLGFLFLREPFSVRRGAGLAAAVAALGCFAIA